MTTPPDPNRCLTRDLDDIADMAPILTRNHADLVAQGERSTEDPALVYPAALDVVDLLDTRTKDLADNLGADPAGAHHLDAMAQARRLGIGPTLTMWARYVDGALDAANIPHWHARHTASPEDQARWLAEHADWCNLQPWANDLHSAIHAIAEALRSHVGPNIVDDAAALTLVELAKHLGVTKQRVNHWRARGRLQACGVNDDGRAVYARRDGEAILVHLYGIPRFTPIKESA